MFNLLTFMHPASFLKQRLYFDKYYKAMNYWTKSVDKNINILGHIKCINKLHVLHNINNEF